MQVYLLTASYSLSPTIKVEEVEVTKIIGGRVYFSDRRWAARSSGHIWDTLKVYYDDEKEAIAAAGIHSQRLLAWAKELLAKAEELSRKYPTIE
jgi:hypothetical protein